MLNSLHGPWAGDAFYWALQRSALFFMDTSGHTDPLFQYCYEFIVDEGLGNRDGFGTEAHWFRCPCLRRLQLLVRLRPQDVQWRSVRRHQRR